MISIRPIFNGLLALLICIGSLPTAIPTLAAPLTQPPGPSYWIQGRVKDTNGNGVIGIPVTAQLIYEPIIFLPGVMGTELGNTRSSDDACLERPSGKVWLALKSLPRLYTLYLDNTGSGPRNLCDRIIPQGRLTSPVKPYEKFINTARRAGFEVLDYPGYDWRLSLDDSVAKLDAYIDQNRGKSRVFLVAHSMGGLLARAYVANQTRAAKVAGVITVGTPYLGSPSMAQTMVTGRLAPPLDLLTFYDQIKEIIRYSPGIQTLLPSKAYHATLTTPYYRPVDGTVLDSYEKTVNYFAVKNYVSTNIFQVAQAFHNNYDGFPSSPFSGTPYPYIIMFSNDRETPVTFRERRCMDPLEPRQALCVDVRTTDLGDGVVPMRSASLQGLSTTGISLCAYNGAPQNPYPDHQNLFSDDRIITDVLAAIAGRSLNNCRPFTRQQSHTVDPHTADPHTADPHTADPPLRTFSIRGHARIMVVNPVGQFTGLSAEGNLVNSLSEIGYFPTNGGITITLPTTLPYQIVIHHQDRQPLQILATDSVPADQYSTERKLQAQGIFAHVVAPAGGITTIAATSSPISYLQAAVDKNADGTYDSLLNVDAILNRYSDLEDTLLPTSSLTFDGVQDAQGNYITPVIASLVAQDTGSGVLASYVSLDEGHTWQSYTRPVTIEPGITASIMVYSVDRAGNQEYPPQRYPISFAGLSRLYLPVLPNTAAPQVDKVIQPSPELETDFSSTMTDAETSVLLAATIQPILTVITTTTGADGYFRFEHLRAGSTYRVKVNHPAAAPDERFAQSSTSWWGEPISFTAPEDDIVQIATSGYHTCVITTVGGVRCWGLNMYGQVGDGTTIDRQTPVNVVGLDRGIVSIRLGDFHSCALNRAGRVKCWGYNRNYQLGSFPNEHSSIPVEVIGNPRISNLIVGYTFTCFKVTTGPYPPPGTPVTPYYTRSGYYCWGPYWASWAFP